MTTSLCDVNVWIALAIEGHPSHETAAAWLAGVDTPHRLIFCRNTQQGVLRLLTQHALFAELDRLPLTNRQAWETYREFLADERVEVQDREPSGLEAQWRRYAVRDTASMKLWADAYLAAFAVCAGYRFVTFDAAFRQFDGLNLLVL